MRIVVATLLITIFFASCEKKSCTDVVCPLQNSICFEGECECLAGFEGDFCDVLSYEKYVGSYQVSESCTTTFAGLQNNYFTSQITVGPTIDLLTIYNFSGRGLPIDATIVSANILAIYEQNIGALSISGGQGRYEVFNNTIRLEYNYTAGTDYHECVGIFTRF